ncbi:oxidoreductase [Neobacillus drentensis]
MGGILTAMKISKLSFSKVEREGDYPGKIVYANFNIDGKSMKEMSSIREFDVVSCLGWGPKPFQNEQILRLLLEKESDFIYNRNSLYICPCTGLDCGAVSLSIKKANNGIIVWDNFALEYENGIDKYFDNIGPFYFEWEQYKNAIENTLFLGEPDYFH